ncbi:MAG: NAD-dependent epimerase/dehydratase family protein [Casimicrobiaceae bacterium]
MDAMTLAGRKLLVTGASGFVGARLVEALAEQSFPVTAAIRHSRGSERIAHLAIDRRSADLVDAGAVRRMVAGHDVVFNLAYDHTRSGQANVEIGRCIADACVAEGVRRLIHASSIVVYDDWPSGDLAETSRRGGGDGDEYRAAKWTIECDLAARAAAGTLDCVILQPTIVYGPFSPLWTDRFAAALLAGRLVLPPGALGRCNGLYVDDLVTALLAAATSAVPAGSHYIISGSEPFPWSQLFAALSHALERNWGERAPLARAPLPGHARHDRPAGRERTVRPVLRWLRRRLGAAAVAKMRARAQGWIAPGGLTTCDPVGESPALFLDSGTCDIAAARHELGYEPKYDATAGLAATAEYLGRRYMPPPRI